MKCLRIVIHGEEHPNYTITKSFEKAFDSVETIWWHNWYNNRAELNRIIKSKVESENYDFIFMQLQEGGVINQDTFENIYNKIPIFNWTGDVRNNLDYFTPIGNHVISLFSNDTDTHKMRELGFRSDYLQTGYDHTYYYNTNQHRLNKIVLIANNYNHGYFANSGKREEMAYALKAEFQDDFMLFGNNWQHIDHKSRLTHSKEEERDIYNGALLAINISHINCAKYYSDRKLRAMACGCLVLSETYQESEHEFIVGKDYDNWDTIDELIKKCHHYILNRDEALKIGKNSSTLVIEKCTWDYRMGELKELIQKYKTQ